jgi:hypothetical protein
MKRYVAIFTTVFMMAILCGALAAQIPATKQPNPNITPLGPHAQQPPGGHPVMTGTIYGFVYWDAKATSHLGPSICNAMAITVVVANKGSYSPLGLVGTQSHVTSMATIHPPLTSVNTTSYDGCAYSFVNAPLGQNLYVKLNLAQAVGTLTPAVVAKDPPVGPIQFSNTPCSKLPPLTKATVGELIGNWGSCQNVAYDVNLQLVNTPQLTVLSANGGSGGNQGGVQSAPLLNPTRPAGMLNSATSQSTSPAPSPANGMLLPAVTPTPAQTSSRTGTPRQIVPATPGSSANTVQLNPKPLPPNGSSTGAFTGGVRPGRTTAITNITDTPAPSALTSLLTSQRAMKVVPGRKVKYAQATNSALIGLLRKQKQAADSELILIARQPRLQAGQVGTIGAGQTMASNRGTISSRLVKKPNVALNVTRAYQSSNLLTPQENAACQQREAQGLAPEILRVDGQTTGIKYSPDPQANPYTIVGCGFGDSPGTVQLLLLQQQQQTNGWNNQGVSNVTLYTVKFGIQSWSDHAIVASVDPNTSGIPDWGSDLQLVVKAGLSGYAFGSQFVALRATVPLANVPQNEVALYQQGSPYFLSPVSNYYGLNGTASVMRQGLPGPVAGQDQFNLKLAPGFVIDSTQTDLLVSNTNANVNSQPATVNGNAITVTYPVLSAQSGNSTAYYSIYGLKVWVTGPVGVAP